jgi:hypothetical protein
VGWVWGGIILETVERKVGMQGRRERKAHITCTHAHHTCTSHTHTSHITHHTHHTSHITHITHTRTRLSGGARHTRALRARTHALHTCTTAIQPPPPPPRSRALQSSCIPPNGHPSSPVPRPRPPRETPAPRPVSSRRHLIRSGRKKGEGEGGLRISACSTHPAPCSPAEQQHTAAASSAPPLLAERHYRKQPAAACRKQLALTAAWRISAL